MKVNQGTRASYAMKKKEVEWEKRASSIEMSWHQEYVKGSASAAMPLNANPYVEQSHTWFTELVS